MEEKPKRKKKYTPAFKQSLDKYQASHTSRYSLRLSDLQDADLIAWLDSIEDRGQYLRALIRADMERHKKERTV